MDRDDVPALVLGRPCTICRLHSDKGQLRMRVVSVCEKVVWFTRYGRIEFQEEDNDQRPVVDLLVKATTARTHRRMDGGDGRTVRSVDG